MQGTLAMACISDGGPEEFGDGDEPCSQAETR